MTFVTAPPGSTVSIWRPAYGPSTPWKYHHGMPFCAAITAVSSWRSGSSRFPHVAYELAFSPRKTKSTGPISDGSSVAGGCASKSPRSDSTRTPSRRIAARLSPRATRWTSVPPRASAAPTYAPMAPAPRTATRMRRHGSHKWEVMHSAALARLALCVNWREDARSEPVGAAEPAVQHGADHGNHHEHGRISVAPRELRHVPEVHAVDAGDHRRHGEDRHPRGDPPHVGVLAHRDLREVRLERAAEQLAEAVDPARDPHEVVVHVAEVVAHLRRDQVEVAAREAVDGRREGPDRTLHLEHLALEAVDALRRVRGVVGEDLLLDLLDVDLEALHRRLVVVDDAVDDRVEHRAGPAAQEVGPPLDRLADRVQIARVAVANGDDERRVDEEHDLAAADHLLAVDVAHGLQHDEQRLAVDLELRALVRLDRVLDGELVEVELARDGVELLRGRLVRAEPDERGGGIAGGARGVGDVEVAR